MKNNEDVKNYQYIELGKLKGNKGDQNYEIPEGIDVNEYGSVSVWCKRFNETLVRLILIIKYELKISSYRRNSYGLW